MVLHVHVFELLHVRSPEPALSRMPEKPRVFPPLDESDAVRALGFEPEA